MRAYRAVGLSFIPLPLYFYEERPQDQDERLRAFGDSAFCRITEENGTTDYGTAVAAVRHLGRRAVSLAVFNVFVIRARA